MQDIRMPLLSVIIKWICIIFFSVFVFCMNTLIWFRKLCMYMCGGSRKSQTTALPSFRPVILRGFACYLTHTHTHIYHNLRPEIHCDALSILRDLHSMAVVHTQGALRALLNTDHMHRIICIYNCWTWNESQINGKCLNETPTMGRIKF